VIGISCRFHRAKPKEAAAMTSGNNPLLTQLMPGFDFMRQFAQAAVDKSATPPLAGWVAPIVSVEELDKRIADLRAVLFWLEQNGQVLRATVQALEVQKMTLAALQGMNLNLADIAKAISVPVHVSSAAQDSSATARGTASGADSDSDPATTKPASAAAQPPAPAMTDPLQWWGALTQQFQTIAASTLREAVQATPPASPTPEQSARSTDPVPVAKPVRPSTAKPLAESAVKPAIKPAIKRSTSKKSGVQPVARRGAA